MELTVVYILSQIFTVLMYITLALSYYVKNRRTILILNFIGLFLNIIAYILLRAWSGLAMCIVAVIRNIIFLIDEKKNGKSDKINKKDIIILIVLYIISIISAVFTYEGFFSLFSVFATMIYTYSVWQKKVIIYKFCGIPVGIAWIIYNAFVMSIFGIILESILLVASTTGYILDLKRKNR